MNICFNSYNFNLLHYISYFEQFYDNQITKFVFKYLNMKILSIAALLLMLTNCAGGNVAKSNWAKNVLLLIQNRSKSPHLSGSCQKKRLMTLIKGLIKNIV